MAKFASQSMLFMFSIILIGSMNISASSFSLPPSSSLSSSSSIPLKESPPLNVCSYVNPSLENCSCYEDSTSSLSVDCTALNDLNFHEEINRIYTHFSQTKRSIGSLTVTDSELTFLNGLPSGLMDVKHLTLNNTQIDLEQIRESSEILGSLKSFKIYREKFTEIPENFFSDLHGLVVLGLNNVGIKAISEDGFRFLEDSLKELSLKGNSMRSIPIAVASLPNLETMDLSDNMISYVSDDSSLTFEKGMKSLSKLLINTINCTCEFGSSTFVSWIRSHAIRGVTCRYPARLDGRDIATTPTEDFCAKYIYSSLGEQMSSSMWILIFSIIISFLGITWITIYP